MPNAENSPTPDFVTALDAEFRVTHFNAACAQYLAHYQRAIQVGVPFGDVIGEAWVQMRPLYERALAGETFQLETTYCNNSHESLWHQYTYAPIRNANGHIIGCLSVVRNTTAKDRPQLPNDAAV